MSDKTDIVTLRALRSAATTKRILAGERLALRMGDKVIADIVPRPRRSKSTLDEILAPVKAAAKKVTTPGKNLILEDRKRFRR